MTLGKLRVGIACPWSLLYGVPLHTYARIYVLYCLWLFELLPSLEIMDSTVVTPHVYILVNIYQYAYVLG